MDRIGIYFPTSYISPFLHYIILQVALVVKCFMNLLHLFVSQSQVSNTINNVKQNETYI